jgi:hypothetical protein
MSISPLFNDIILGHKSCFCLMVTAWIECVTIFSSRTCMCDNNQCHLHKSENSYLFYLFIFIAGSLILVSIFSCSSNDPTIQDPAELKADGTDVESVKINNLKISVGDRLDTVYDQIGKGISTTITRDQGDPDSIIISHDYVSGKEKYRISLCSVDKGNYHICRISLLKFFKQTSGH